MDHQVGWIIDAAVGLVLAQEILYAEFANPLHRRRGHEGFMRLSRNDVLFWIVAAAIILGAVGIASLRLRHTGPNRMSLMAALVGGLIVFRVGIQFIWGGLRMRHSQPLWLGSAVSTIGLGVAAVSLYLM